MWNWDLCLIDHPNDSAALRIGWLDFAYFVQHRKDFLDVRHNHFMGGFAAGASRSTDYKVLHDGTIVEFDSQQLTGVEREVFDRPEEIRFEVVRRAMSERRDSLHLV